MEITTAARNFAGHIFKLPVICIIYGIGPTHQNLLDRRDLLLLPLFIIGRRSVRLQPWTPLPALRRQLLQEPGGAALLC